MITTQTQPSLIAEETPRHLLMDGFLRENLGDGYQRKLVAGDASFRKYHRAFADNRTFIVMDAPPEHEDTGAFLKITHWLRRHGFRAAEVFAENREQGFLLLEDFGDISFTRHLQSNPQQEAGLYLAAVDILVSLRRAKPLPAMADYDWPVIERELRILCDWYMPTRLSGEALKDASESFIECWRSIWQQQDWRLSQMVLRDYHADNLMWQAEQNAQARVCLLDYQDALQGDAVYDLVSLLEDARRDVSSATVEAMLAHYAAQTGEPVEEIRRRFHLLGAQRNCKIIGIFHRLNQRDGKPAYLDFLPRVFDHLRRDLAHPSLAPLVQWQQDYPQLELL